MTSEILNIFETPWLLLMISAAVWMVISIVALMKGMENRRWRLLLPLAGVLVAFGVDYFVKTDYEKIDILATILTESAVDGDLSQLETIISEEYSDAKNKSKRHLLAFCKPIYGRGQIQKINRKYFNITVTRPRAKCDLDMVVILDPESSYAMTGNIVALETRLHLSRSDNGMWQIVSTEILKANNYDVSWKTVR
jgi:hypothetical protein